jgi:serine/threonine-protein phosphatase 2A regulatory subunit B''
MLKKNELTRYAPGLTGIFIDRVFEEFQTFEGEMDYKTFLDFVLAMENKRTPQSLHYFWRVLDVFHKGAIDTFIINMFFQPVIKKLEQKMGAEYKVDDLKDELWDMAKPSMPTAITL